MCGGQNLFLVYFVSLLGLLILLNFQRMHSFFPGHKKRLPTVATHTSHVLMKRSPEQLKIPTAHIGANVSFETTYQQRGYMFNESGAWRELSVAMTSSFVHDFTPYVSREAERRFVDPAGGNIYHVMSPAMTYRNGR